MNIIEHIKQNYKEPRYMLPAIVYIPLLFTGYTICNLVNTEKADVGNDNLETTEYLNDKIPDAHIKGDGLGNKYQSMLESYGKIKDASAVENVEKQEEQKEEFQSQYSDAELAALEEQSKEAENAVEQIRRMQESMRETQNRTAGLDSRFGNTPEENEAVTEVQRVLAEAQQQATAPTSQQDLQSASQQESQIDVSTKTTVTQEEEPKNTKVVKEIAEDAEPEEVVKVTKETSDYFNTIGSNEPERKLIKAIIDEDIKAVDGSRVRLRLLDDIEVGTTTIKKGSYLYAEMSGFGSQRVKGTVKSVFINDELIKINLSIYDTDGMEGLYVPASDFRSTTKDIGSSALSSTPSFNTGTTIESAFVQWGMNAVQQGVQKAGQAISKNIKKNKVKLKYGTFVYLVNSKEKKTPKQGNADADVQQKMMQQQIKSFQSIIQNAR